jgi:hypothetical protein
MRLWSLHPRYLDSRGLVACWRETLLAQKVLAGGTKGYRHHPQLKRFQATAQPLAAVAAYLRALAAEAEARGYHFDTSKINAGEFAGPLTVTSGQLEHEWQHLLVKLAQRAPQAYETWLVLAVPDPHPLFVVVPGPIAPWEVVTPPPAAEHFSGGHTHG